MLDEVGGEIRQIQDQNHWNYHTMKCLLVEKSWKLDDSRKNNVWKKDFNCAEVKSSADSLFDPFQMRFFYRIPSFQVLKRSLKFYDEFSRWLFKILKEQNLKNIKRNIYTLIRKCFVNSSLSESQFTTYLRFILLVACHRVHLKNKLSQEIFCLFTTYKAGKMIFLI